MCTHGVAVALSLCAPSFVSVFASVFCSRRSLCRLELCEWRFCAWFSRFGVQLPLLVICLGGGLVRMGV